LAGSTLFDLALARLANFFIISCFLFIYFLNFLR
jgi:hypothetical protein